MPKDAARYGIRATRPEDLAHCVADALANGCIVGVYETSGRGGTLADPRGLEAHVLIEREGARGFVPAVMAERAPELFAATPTWTVASARVEWRDRLGAMQGLEPDVAVRPVAEGDAPRLHSILRAFAAITGLPALLERRFEDDGGTAVVSPEDALRRFLATGLDSLVLDGVLFQKCHELHQPVPHARLAV